MKKKHTLGYLLKDWADKKHRYQEALAGRFDERYLGWTDDSDGKVTVGDMVAAVERLKREEREAYHAYMAALAAPPTKTASDRAG